MNNAENSPALLETDNLRKSYSSGEKTIEILKGIQLRIEKGDYLSVIGPSGVGKTTLLNVIGLLDPPSKGTIQFQGEEITGAGEGKQSRVRNQNIGFVFQFYHLIPELTALENVYLPSMIEFGGTQWIGRKHSVKQRARKLMNQVELSDRTDHYPSELSGGERQRVAIARAMVQNPDLLICDEPTGNLDQKTGDVILELIEEMYEQNETAIIMASHDTEQAVRADRVYELQDGRLTHLKKEDISV